MADHSFVIQSLHYFHQSFLHSHIQSIIPQTAAKVNFDSTTTTTPVTLTMTTSNKTLLIALAVLLLATTAAASSHIQCEQVLEFQTLSLSCANATDVINKVSFASYGTPAGACDAPATNDTCHSSNSHAIASSLCVGKQNCTILAGNGVFSDPCVGTFKNLTVQWECGVPNSIDTPVS
jgi:hypothetical protein